MTDHDPTATITLSDLQLDVMRVLWARGEASVAEVATELALQRGLAHTTVATVLTRLAARGVVSARREARQLHYRAEVSEPQVRRGMVAGLLGSLFGGDARALLAHLVDQRDLEPDDLGKLEAMLRKDAARKGGQP